MTSITCQWNTFVWRTVVFPIHIFQGRNVMFSGGHQTNKKPAEHTTSPLATHPALWRSGMWTAVQKIATATLTPQKNSVHWLLLALSWYAWGAMSYSYIIPKGQKKHNIFFAVQVLKQSGFEVRKKCLKVHECARKIWQYLGTLPWIYSKWLERIPSLNGDLIMVHGYSKLKKIRNRTNPSYKISKRNIRKTLADKILACVSWWVLESKIMRVAFHVWYILKSPFQNEHEQPIQTSLS